MLIRSELLALGIKSVDMVSILQKDYGITVNLPNYSACINGKRNTGQAQKIREACWDYINKRKKTKEV